MTVWVVCVFYTLNPGGCCITWKPFFRGLMVGILATVLVQSSSTSTSIVVGLVGARQLSVHNAPWMSWMSRMNFRAVWMESKLIDPKLCNLAKKISSVEKNLHYQSTVCRQRRLWRGVDIVDIFGSCWWISDLALMAGIDQAISKVGSHISSTMVLCLLSWPCEVNEITSKQDLKPKKSRVSLLTKILLFEIKHFPSGRIPFFPSLVIFFHLCYKKSTKRRCRQFQSWWVQILEHPSQIPSLGPPEMPEPLFRWFDDEKPQRDHFDIWKMARWIDMLTVCILPRFFFGTPPSWPFFVGKGFLCCWIWRLMVKSKVSGRILLGAETLRFPWLTWVNGWSWKGPSQVPPCTTCLDPRFLMCAFWGWKLKEHQPAWEKKTWKVFLLFQIVCSGLVF